VRGMQDGATTFDVVCDCHGFSIMKNLDPRPGVDAFEMLKHPYRARLRYGFIVDAPSAFGTLWRLASGAVPKQTRGKITFVTREEAVAAIKLCSGPEAARDVEKALTDNRKLGRSPDAKLPSHLEDRHPGLATESSPGGQV